MSYQYRNQYNNQYNNNHYNNYNNYDNNNNSSNNYYPRPYELRGESIAINPRIQELSGNSLVQNNNQYRHNSSKEGSNSSSATAIDTQIIDSTNNNDDDVSLRSSIYSQPDQLSRNNSTKNHAFTTNVSPTHQSSLYDNPRYHEDHLMGYPLSSPHSNPFSFNNKQQQPLTTDGTRNIDNQNIDYSNNNQSFDVYNDFNNNYHHSRNQSYYNDEEATRNNTMTSPDNNNDNNINNNATSSPYTWHNSNKIDTDDKEANRQSIVGFIGADSKSKKQNRCCCCSRKLCVIITFVVLVLLAVTTFFVWPRIPIVKILDASPNGTPVITQNPPLVKLDFTIQAQIDNKENWVPFKFNRIEVQVFDSNAISTYNRPIATGNITDYTLPQKQVSTVGFPLTVNYVAASSSDPVLQDFVSACTQQSDGNVPTTLNLRVDVKLFVWGIDWIVKPSISVPVNNLKCPYPQSS